MVDLIPLTTDGLPAPFVLFLHTQSRSALDLEIWIRTIRQVYAFSLLVSSDYQQNVPMNAVDIPLDLEMLLDDQDRLKISSVGTGSWILTLKTFAKNGYKALADGVAAVYPRGREALLQRAESESRLRQLAVSKEEFTQNTASFDELLRRADALGASEEVRSALKSQLLTQRSTQNAHQVLMQNSTTELLERSDLPRQK